jgi:hypothetical protein
VASLDRRSRTPQFRTRSRAALCLALAALAVGCTNQINCSPCGPPASIDITSIKSTVDSVRVCVEADCGVIRSLQPEQEFVWVNAAIYDHPSVTLETFADGKRLDSYVITGVVLRRPSGKNCDCGESVGLIPQPGGRLVTRQQLASSTPPTTSPTR